MHSISSSRIWVLSVSHSRELSNLLSTFSISRPNAFPVPLRQLLHPPEPLTLEDGFPLVLEESDELDEVDRNATFQAHAHVVGLHVEAARSHARFISIP